MIHTNVGGTAVRPRAFLTTEKGQKEGQRRREWRPLNNDRPFKEDTTVHSGQSRNGQAEVKVG